MMNTMIGMMNTVELSNSLGIDLAFANVHIIHGAVL